ncbi:MAG TPA: glycosyltransferase [candidate division Zixibacteria bacterium]|nr:glycosyltransferase [candidate division Zixibacteria bacterium]
MPGSRKYNILLYTETSGIGGAEKVLLDLATNLDRELYEVYVVLHRSRWLHEQLDKNGIPVEIIPSRKSWDIRFIRNFMKHCRKIQADLIHSHLFGANLYAGLAGRMLRLPVIATVHNEYIMPGSNVRHLRLKNFIIRNFAKKIVLVADYMKEDYIEKGHYSHARLKTIYNGIDLKDRLSAEEKASARQELGFSKDDVLIGNVANFRAPKGHNYLIQAAARVVERIPHARFLLVGEGTGELRKDAEKQIESLGLMDNVLLLGFRTDVEDLLKVFDIFVLSSISEGLPLSIVEAMGAGLPIVATDVGGLPELVEKGRNGYLVPPRDPEKLAALLLELLGDDELRVSMGRASREIAENKFSIDRMIGQYQDLYQELLS